VLASPLPYWLDHNRAIRSRMPSNPSEHSGSAKPMIVSFRRACMTGVSASARVHLPDLNVSLEGWLSARAAVTVDDSREAF